MALARKIAAATTVAAEAGCGALAEGVQPERADDPVVLVHDGFTEATPRGRLVGTQSTSGRPRHVVDEEAVISADNGALRIQPLIEPGWARAGIAYGPFRRANGLAFAVSLLNGHNTAQAENLSETFRDRLDRWLAGPEVYRRRERLAQWLRSRRKLRMWRQWRWWWRARKGGAAMPGLNENLALGWFGGPRPADPLREGNGLVMHATGADNGELWARVGEAMLPTVRGVQNLPMHYVVVLRERGAAYYAASLPGNRGFGVQPLLRPLAIDALGDQAEVHAGVFQSTLGQIGFRLDTRLYGLRIAQTPEWSHWYGSAQGADTFEGAAPLAGRVAPAGGTWELTRGALLCTAKGLVADADDSLALLQLAAPSGLLHMMVDMTEADATGPDASVALVWRAADDLNHWQVSLGPGGCELTVCVAGSSTIVARDESQRLRAGAQHAVQVLDDGQCIGLHLDGALLFGQRFEERRLHDATGAGVAMRGRGGPHLQRFEAHPRSCPLPPVLALPSPPWRLGTEPVLGEDFEGPARELDGKPTSSGGQVWRKSMGSGHIDIDGTGAAKVRADAAHPNPGRLAYTVAWAQAGFADLEVEITPPGTARGQREHGRSGLIFWQDEANFLMLNNWLNDSYGGASVSCFTCFDGFEDLYDAVWTNVGARVRWGVPHRFRVAFDGTHLLALVDDEPVLYRALTDIYPDAPRLQIRRVGLLANWEWGNDTGSRLRRFQARV